VELLPPVIKTLPSANAVATWPARPCMREPVAAKFDVHVQALVAPSAKASRSGSPNSVKTQAMMASSLFIVGPPIFFG